MLIVLGGFLGSGRTLLARYLAEVAGFHYYPLHERKMRRLLATRDRRLYEKVIPPSTDGARMKIFQEVLDELPRISKMYTGVVLDDAMHRENSRSFFLKALRAHFAPVVFVWIESPEKTVDQTFDAMLSRGIISSIGSARKRREQTIREFEPFSFYKPLLFFHRAPTKANAKVLHMQIQYALSKGIIGD